MRKWLLILCAVMLMTMNAGAFVPLASAEGETLEPIEFTIFHPDPNRRIPPDEAVIVQQVFENTGVHLRWQVPAAEPIERLNIMLATDDLPDLIFFEEFEKTPLMNHFIEAGKLLDVEPLLQQYAPDVYGNIDHFIDRIRAKDGKIYYLPSYYGFGDKSDTRFYPETATGLGVRSGLLEELGWYDPDDFDALLELLRTCKERYPEMSPMALALGPQGFLDELHIIGAGAYGLKYDLSNIILVDDEIKYFTDVPQMKEWYAFLNKIHREGLLDIESPVMSKDMLKTKFVAGNVFSFFGETWEIGSEFNALQIADGLHERVVNEFFPRANQSIEKVTYAQYTADLYTSGIAITNKNRDVERFMKFYDYLNHEDGWYKSHAILNEDFTGENTFERTEGWDYIVRNDVEPIRPGMKMVVASAWLGSMWESDENWWWNTRGLENFREFKYREGNYPGGQYDYVGDQDVGMWWDEDTTRVRAAYGTTGLTYWQVQSAMGSDITYITALTLDPESDAEIAKLTMQEYLKVQIPRIIVANSEQEFEDQWQAMNEKLSADGKQIYVDAKNALYGQRLADWGIEQ